MTSEEARQLVVQYVEDVLNRGKLDMLNDICAPNYKRHLSPTADPLNLNEQRERLTAIRRAFPNWNLELQQTVCEGDLVAFRAIVSGTQSGPFLDLPATQKSFTASALDLVRIRDFRFIEHWGGPDLLMIAQQLGATLLPKP